MRKSFIIAAAIILAHGAFCAADSITETFNFDASGNGYYSEVDIHFGTPTTTTTTSGAVKGNIIALGFDNLSGLQYQLPVPQNSQGDGGFAVTVDGSGKVVGIVAFDGRNNSNLPYTWNVDYTTQALSGLSSTNWTTTANAIKNAAGTVVLPAGVTAYAPTGYSGSSNQQPGDSSVKPTGTVSTTFLYNIAGTGYTVNETNGAISPLPKSAYAGFALLTLVAVAKFRRRLPV